MNATQLEKSILKQRVKLKRVYYTVSNDKRNGVLVMLRWMRCEETMHHCTCCSSKGHVFTRSFQSNMDAGLDVWVFQSRDVGR